MFCSSRFSLERLFQTAYFFFPKFPHFIFSYVVFPLHFSREQLFRIVFVPIPTVHLFLRIFSHPVLHGNVCSVLYSFFPFFAVHLFLRVFPHPVFHGHVYSGLPQCGAADRAEDLHQWVRGVRPAGCNHQEQADIQWLRGRQPHGLVLQRWRPVAP